ncbi:double-strand break repair protein AddB [Ferrovibrio xuzhouensis]|uniref:Double-strand break repair protein AddB n=1 Tax=Ferrovibrio xuzhouensis TaxID=1576914 RepID=A0ABV7VB90_9PROT
MPDRAAPAVFSIAPGRPFLDLLAAEILERWGDAPERLSRVTVLLPTRRACRALTEAFLRQRDGRALLLPAIRPLGDVDEDELDLRGAGMMDGRAGDDALPFAPRERDLLLAKLVRASPLAGGDAAGALRLAHQLGQLLDTAATEEVDLTGLIGLAGSIDLARHWQATLDFLDVIRAHWPAIKAEAGRLDAAEHRRLVTDRWIAHWQAEPPQNPVIAAGSTGSIPATARLLKLVCRLPQGLVILPGLDRDLDEAAWTAAKDEPTHPQHMLARLLDSLGVLRGEVAEWRSEDSSGAPAHARLLSAALLPPGETHRWRDLPAPEDAAFAGLQRIEAPGLHEEAVAIALALRETLETPGRTAALITPDRVLARRVAAELARYDGLAIDDSAGRPLAQTPPAIFLRLLAGAVAADFAAVPLLALLKHPFCRLGRSRRELLRWTRRIERSFLRGPQPETGIEALGRRLAGDDRLLPLFAAFRQAIAPFARLRSGDSLPLPDILRLLTGAAEALAEPQRDGGETMPLWQREAGEALHDLVTELLQTGDILGPLPVAQGPRLLDALLEGRVVRPRHGSHTRLFIWGLLEARLQQADRIILGGLNEGTWPPQAEEDPWLSRPMREQLGLAPPERRLGQTAHDFLQAACGSDVILSRATKVDGTPTVPARWLLRLDAMLKGHPRWTATRAPRYLAWAEQLDQPETAVRSEPPMPRPPVEARPRSLYVTDIQTWVRDPYAIYAKRILRLRRLDPVDAPPDARLRGNIIHDVLDRFLKRHADALPADDAALDELLALGRAAFGLWLDQPQIAVLWWPRFERAMRWFVGYERERRAAGFMPALLEQDGALSFAAPAGPFTLKARADRIDRRAADGAVAVLDYKTGNSPGVKEVNVGLAPQLPLEAAIALGGGFDGLTAREIAELVYISLRGGAEPGRAVNIRGRDIPPPTDIAMLALEHLQGWVAQFDDPDRAYLSRPRPQFVQYPGDYDHLARVAERAEGGEDA